LAAVLRGTRDGVSCVGFNPHTAIARNMAVEWPRIDFLAWDRKSPMVGMALAEFADNSDLFEDVERWPRKPYCSEDKTARRIRRLASAMKYPYIQANPPHLRVWSIFDVDRPGGAIAWEDAMLPPPTWASVNQGNMHAHLAWGLRAPVLVDSPDLRQRPLRFLCAVEAGFRAKLEADQGYSGLMTKNPVHPQWRTWRVLRGPRSLYDLEELADWVDLPKYLPRRNPEEIGLGRNVVLFDWVRRYAYREIRDYLSDGDFNSWQSHLNNRALIRNGDFQNSLDWREVKHISKSVSKWVWHRFDIDASDAKFGDLQAYRGKAGMQSRWGDNEDKKATARLLVAKGVSYRGIARELGVNHATIIRWLK